MGNIPSITERNFGKLPGNACRPLDPDPGQVVPKSKSAPPPLPRWIRPMCAALERGGVRRSGDGQMLPNGLRLRMHGCVFGARSRCGLRSRRAKWNPKTPVLSFFLRCCHRLLVLGSSLVATSPSLLYTAGRKPGKSPPAAVSGVAAGERLPALACLRRPARLYLVSQRRGESARLLGPALART